MKMDEEIEVAHTVESRGIVGQSDRHPSNALAKSWMSRTLSFSQSELYPKLCMRTSRNPASVGIHS